VKEEICVKKIIISYPSKIDNRKAILQKLEIAFYIYPSKLEIAPIYILQNWK
jgi:hypothetical protein